MIHLWEDPEGPLSQSGSGSPISLERKSTCASGQPGVVAWVPPHPSSAPRRSGSCTVRPGYSSFRAQHPARCAALTRHTDEQSRELTSEPPAAQWQACALSRFSRIRLFCDPPPPRELQPARLPCPWGFSRQEYWSGLPCLSMGILQARILEWVATPSSRGSSRPGD